MYNPVLSVIESKEKNLSAAAEDSCTKSSLMLETVIRKIFSSSGR